MAVTIDEQLANFRQLRAIQVESLADTDAKIEALTKAKKLLDEEVKVAITRFDGNESPSTFIPTQAVVQRIQQPDVDISPVAGAENIPQAMFAWADANDGKLDGRELTPVLRKSGLSKATTDESILATITNFATRPYVEHWKKLGPNVFERKYPEAEAVPEPENDVQEQPDQPDTEPLAAD